MKKKKLKLSLNKNVISNIQQKNINGGKPARGLTNNSLCQTDYTFCYGVCAYTDLCQTILTCW